MSSRAAGKDSRQRIDNTSYNVYFATCNISYRLVKDTSFNGGDLLATAFSARGLRFMSSAPRCSPAVL